VVAPGCAAPPPAGAAEAIAGLHGDRSGRVAYREEVHHPALAEPETADGYLSVTESGRLVRDQHRPRREISEVGETLLSIRQGPGAPENLMPIPDSARPMFEAIRHAVVGDAAAIARGFELELVATRPLWRVRLRPKDAGARGTEISLIGCGEVLRGMEIVQPNGVRRVLGFELLP